MSDTAERMRQIEDLLAGLPTGYISKKMISSKERLYLQWLENGKLKSKYIKAADFDAISAQVETRKRLQAEPTERRKQAGRALPSSKVTRRPIL